MTGGHLRRHRSRVEERLALVAGGPVAVDPNALVFSGGAGSRRTYVDGRPWRPESTSRRLRKLKERENVRQEVDLHGLRRPMITELFAVGADPRTVIGRAGHCSPVTHSPSRRPGRLGDRRVLVALKMSLHKVAMACSSK
jgi:hypothetical protein